MNRTVHSGEVKLLPALLESSDITWVRRELKKSDKVKEWTSHPFPGVRVPTNCCVMYSTLPDSKSVFSLLVIVTSQCFIKVWDKYNSPRCLSWAIKAKLPIRWFLYGLRLVLCLVPSWFCMKRPTG